MKNSRAKKQTHFVFNLLFFAEAIQERIVLLSGNNMLGKSLFKDFFAGSYHHLEFLISSLWSELI